MTNLPTNFSIETIATSAREVVRWVPDPRTRGTFGLFIGCVTTLVLCVWTSLHLNVPQKYESLAHRLTHKLGWMLLGVFAPELVVYTAWRQWMSANILCQKVNRVRVGLCYTMISNIAPQFCCHRIRNLNKMTATKQNSGPLFMLSMRQWEVLSLRSIP
jgi:hypothetical protein